jgi:DNA-binding MarR family transcriptional regulator
MTSIPCSFLDWAFQQHLTGRELAVLIAIKRHEDAPIFPNVSQLAAYSGTARQYVHPCINDLIRRGLIRDVPTMNRWHRYKVVQPTPTQRASSSHPETTRPHSPAPAP